MNNLREGWADYFEEHNIQYAFFSAANSTAIQEERARIALMAEDTSEEESSSGEDVEELDSEEEEGARMKIPKSGNKLASSSTQESGSKLLGVDETEDEDSSDSDSELAGRMRRGAGISTPGSDEAARTRILSVLELEDLFLKQAPEGNLLSYSHRTIVGLERTN